MINRPNFELKSINSILYLLEIGNDFYRINEYLIMFFYIYRKARESFCLIEITAEIHVVNILKLKILIEIYILNIKKIFINFRIRTLAINIIPEFSANIRTIRKNIKTFKIIVNSRKKNHSVKYYKRNPDTDEEEIK
jgi:hypothetical protein